MKVTQAAQDALQTLHKSKGNLSPHDVVAEAEADENSPLRRYFTWDDSEAAHKCRVIEARTLIRSVKLVVTIEDVEVVFPKYVHDPGAVHATTQRSIGPLDEDGNEIEISSPRGPAAGFTETLFAKQDSAKAKLILASEISRAISYMKRALRIAAVFGLEAEIDSEIEALQKLAAKVSEAA